MIMMMRAASHVNKARVTCCVFIPLLRKQAVLLPVNESSAARESPRLRKTPPPPSPPSRSYRHRPQSPGSPSLPPLLSPDTTRRLHIRPLPTRPRPASQSTTRRRLPGCARSRRCSGSGAADSLIKSHCPHTFTAAAADKLCGRRGDVGRQERQRKIRAPVHNIL